MFDRSKLLSHAKSIESLGCASMLKRTRFGCKQLLLVLLLWTSIHTASDNMARGQSESSQHSAKGTVGRQSVDGRVSSPSPLMATPVATRVLDATAGHQMARSFTGTLRAKRASDLGFKRIGRLEKILVARGDRVEQGALIAELDLATLEAELGILAAQRAAAVARLNELLAGPRQQTLEAARAQLVELTAVRNQMQATFERRQRLANSDAISVQDIDDARHQLAAAEAKLASQKQVLAELEEGTRREQLDAQRAEVERLDATIKSIQVQFEESRIRAPYAGIIARRMADEGAIVQPGEPLVRIIEEYPLEAWIGVTPEALEELTLGEPHQLTIRSRTRTGILKSVLPEIDSSTRTQTVIFELDPPVSGDSSEKLSISSEVVGQIVQLTLTQRVEQAGFWLPVSALTRSNKGLWSVYVVVPLAGSDELTIERSDVEVIQIDSTQVLVRGTIKNGDRIVISGVQKVTVGQKVTLTDDVQTEGEVSANPEAINSQLDETQ
jgi:RND family efflux transporter MFP subunit